MTMLSRRRFTALGAGGLSLAALAGTAMRPARAQSSRLIIKQMVAHDYLPALMAREKGLFATHGLDVDLGVATPMTLPGVVGGSMHITTGTGPQVALAAVAGMPIVVVSGATIQTRERPTTAVVARAEAGIKNAQDFVGKKVVTPGLNAVFHVMFKKWLKDQGVDPNAVAYVESGFPQMGDVLRTGAADAALSLEPFLSRMVGAGGVRVADYFRTERPYTFVSFYVSERKWAETHRAELRAFRAALAGGLAAAREDLPAALAVESKEYKVPPAALAGLGPPDARFDVTPDDLQFWFDISREIGLIDQKLDAASSIVF